MILRRAADVIAALATVTIGVGLMTDNFQYIVAGAMTAVVYIVVQVASETIA